MEIEAPIKSPIERHVFADPIHVVNNDTSGLNMFTDSRTVSPTNSVPPENPFLTNTILEETVIGGGSRVNQTPIHPGLLRNRMSVLLVNNDTPVINVSKTLII